MDRAFWKNATVASDEFKALNAFSQWQGTQIRGPVGQSPACMEVRALRFAGTFDLHAFRTVRSLKRWCGWA